MVLQLIKFSSFFSLLFFALLPFQARSRSVYFAYSANADGMAYLSAAVFASAKINPAFSSPSCSTSFPAILMAYPVICHSTWKKCACTAAMPEYEAASRRIFLPLQVLPVRRARHRSSGTRKVPPEVLFFGRFRTAVCAPSRNNRTVLSSILRGFALFLNGYSVQV